MRLIGINAPAKIINEEYTYYILENNSRTQISNTQKYEGKIIYPSAIIQITRTAIIDLAGEISKLNDNQDILRKVRIEYEWLSHDKEYYFEGEWKLDKTDNAWKEIYQKAN